MAWKDFGPSQRWIVLLGWSIISHTLGMMAGRNRMGNSNEMRKVTISLPAELVHFADQRARELSASRSQVIGQALSASRRREEERLAAEGYRYYAEEASDFAESSSRAVTEAWTEGRGTGSVEATDGA